LTEAKEAARRIDQKKLMKEKSLLIKDINYQLKENNFFNKKIKITKIMQQFKHLINEWSKQVISQFI
jgi:hypothetical protein